MRVIQYIFLCGAAILAPAALWAQNPGSALQGSNLLNPNISVVGWLQGEAGRRLPGGAEPEAFQVKEAEMAFQSVVDPYSRADVFASLGAEGLELEEGYLTWFHLPGDLALKAGKFRANLGKFNRTHTPETSFADRPLVHEKFFGEEGLAGVGTSLSWHVPNPWLLLNLDAETMTAPETQEVPLFGRAESSDLLYLGRLSGYYDLSESVNATLGATYAAAPAGQKYDAVSDSSATLGSRVQGLDLTFRWKNPRRAIYRSFLWQTEIFWSAREPSSAAAVKSRGFFSHLEYQFARRWRVGARYDWTQAPDNSDQRTQGSLAYLTFTPSEFSLISLQGKQVKREDAQKETLGFLKVTFNIGPHGVHPF